LYEYTTVEIILKRGEARKKGGVEIAYWMAKHMIPKPIVGPMYGAARTSGTASE
jgi:hypothetical protein